MYQNILWEQKDRSAVITLNRPRVLNALSRALKGELSDALTRIKAELGQPATVVASGGQAGLVSCGSKHIQHTDEFLTLTGLRLIWDKNQATDAGQVSTVNRAGRAVAPVKKAQR